MKNKILIALFTSLALYACGDKKNEVNAESAHTANSTEAKSKFVDKKIIGYDKDPVCLMPINDEMEDSTLYNGTVYGFCCNGCKQDFVKSPTDFIAKGK